MKPIRNRLVPAKIMLFILYGQYEWLERRAGGSIQVRLGPLARTVRISSIRLRDALRHLEKVGIIRSLEFSYGKALVVVNPPLLSWEGDTLAPTPFVAPASSNKVIG